MGIVTRGGAGIGGVAGVFGPVLLVCAAFYRLCQCFWIGVCGGAEYAVALYLFVYFVLWRRVELPAFPKKKINFAIVYPLFKKLWYDKL